MGFDRVMSGRKFESRRGFTIVELLVVVVVVIVIGLLATVSKLPIMVYRPGLEMQPGLVTYQG